MDPFTAMIILVSSYATYQQFDPQAEMAKIQEKQSRLQARQTEVDLEAEKTEAAVSELDRQRHLAKVLSSQTAAFGASGADLSGGSFQAIQTADVKSAAEATRRGKIFSGVRKAGFKTNIEQSRINARSAKFASRSFRQQALIGAGVSIFKGVDSAGGFKKSKGSK